MFSLRVLAGNFSLFIVLCFSDGRQYSSLIFKFKFTSDLRPFTQTTTQIDCQVLQLLNFVHVFPPCSGWQLLRLGLVHYKDLPKPQRRSIAKC